MLPNKSIEEIASFLNGKASTKGLFVFRINSLKNAIDGDLSFYTDIKLKSELVSTKASVVILRKKDISLCPTNYIVVDDPYYAFSQVSNLFNPIKDPVPCVKTSVKIGVNSTIPSSCFIDDFVVIGDNVTIGEHVIIESGVKIENNVSIGSNSKLQHNCVIKHDVKIGNNCHIFSNAVIGSDGFGYAFKNQKWNKIQQLGSVVIMDNVDIGSNTAIDRGALQDTIIHDGVKIDNQVQIGHNCEILDHTIIAGCVGIAGSTRIGKFCKIGGAAMILGHLEIAENSTISPGTMISKSINTKGKTFTGIFPFFEKNDWIKVTMIIKRLLRKRD